MFGLGPKPSPAATSGFVLPMFSIYDIKAETFFPPMLAGNVAEALRVFGDLLTDAQSKLSKHPTDYRLYRLGEFHVDTGAVVALDSGPQLVEEGLLLVKEA